jgi:uncharacterized protein YlaI
MPWEIGKITPAEIKKHGRPLRNEKDIKEALNAEKLMMFDALNTEGYKNLGFQCICQEKVHSLNDSFYAAKVLCAKPVKFLYLCKSTEVLIFFEVKGALVQKCYPIWFVPQDLFIKHSEKILKSHKDHKKLKRMFE